MMIVEPSIVDALMKDNQDARKKWCVAHVVCVLDVICAVNPAEWKMKFLQSATKTTLIKVMLDKTNLIHCVILKSIQINKCLKLTYIIENQYFLSSLYL